MKYYFLGPLNEKNKKFRLYWELKHKGKDQYGRQRFIENAGDELTFVFDDDVEKAKDTIIYDLEFVIGGFHKKMGIKAELDELNKEQYLIREQMVDVLKQFVESKTITAKLHPKIDIGLESEGFTATTMFSKAVLNLSA